MTQSAKLIDALNGTFGRHAGYRASHAKGFTARGRFIPSSQQSGVQVPLLAQEQPVLARFSVGGGKPGISDKSPTVRGIGLEIGQDGSNWIMALISNPVFFANSADQFHAFLAARVPDPSTGAPDPNRVQTFNEANPNTIPHQAYLKSVSPCRCYSNEEYHSGHAYRVRINDSLVEARVMLKPEAGRVGLTDQEMAELPDSFLFDRFLGKLGDKPARWTMYLVLANEADNVADPTVPWDGAHTEVELGTVQIELPDERAGIVNKVFDPAHMPDGVVAPQDQVFPLRSAAYAESFARRSG